MSLGEVVACIIYGEVRTVRFPESHDDILFLDIGNVDKVTI